MLDYIQSPSPLLHPISLSCHWRPIASLEVKDLRESLDTTSLFTLLSNSSSARITVILQPPPMRNEIFLPVIRKRGDVRVPLGLSPCLPPACASLEGLFSNLPIHQSPWCLDGCPLWRAVGLSPKVGWLLNAVPVLFHPSIPCSKSKLQAVKIIIERRLRLLNVV